MALFPGDAVIKTCIELALEDIKKDPWVIEDIFSVFIENKILILPLRINHYECTTPD